MINKPIFIMLIGLPASGKSSQAKLLSKKYDAEIISSDSLRIELYGDIKNQEHNEDIFNELHKRIRANLIRGKNVIMDATNISIKSRKTAIRYIKNINCNKIGYVMAKPIKQCIKDNIGRINSVPEHAINKMYMNFQIPFYEEGFDDIIIHRFDNGRKTLCDCIKEMDGFNQHNPNHKLNLLQHSISSAKYMESKYSIYMNMAFLLHDYSKIHTQKFDENGVAHYYQHQCVGAYEVMSEVELYINDDKLLNVLFLINYHMMPFAWKIKKTHDKWRNIFGKYKYEILLDFNKADIKSSKMEYGEKSER